MVDTLQLSSQAINESGPIPKLSGRSAPPPPRFIINNSWRKKAKPVASPIKTADKPSILCDGKDELPRQKRSANEEVADDRSHQSTINRYLASMKAQDARDEMKILEETMRLYVPLYNPRPLIKLPKAPVQSPVNVAIHDFDLSSESSEDDE